MNNKRNWALNVQGRLGNSVYNTMEIKGYRTIHAVRVGEVRISYSNAQVSVLQTCK